MSEITKLYDNAGINPTHYDACALEDKYWNNEELANQYGTFDGYLSFECPHDGQGCYSTCEYAYDKDEYPTFIAEKQIEIIKVLCLKDEWNFLCYFAPCSHQWVLNISDTPITDEWDEFKITVMGKNEEPFGEVLAKLVNSLWQDLTEEEKQQVKGVLE